MHNRHTLQLVERVLLSGLTAALTDEQLLQAFVGDRSVEAFTEIVRRHGSMVLGVCRRILQQEQDAEDALQATFLVLVRKAKNVDGRAGLGCWLYGVAFRTAQKAKLLRYREQRRLTRKLNQQPDKVALPAEPCDWLPLLDQELQRLSKHDRLPILLCDLLGKSRREAAQELGLTEGTLSSRLARARARLKTRLERRGVIPSITLAGLILQSSELSASLIEACSSLAVGLIRFPVSQLSDGVIRSMFIQSLLKPMYFMAGVAVISLGVIWWASPKTEPGDPNTIVAQEGDKDKLPKKGTDEEQLQGLWEVTYADFGGNKNDPEITELAKNDWEFKQDGLALRRDGKMTSAFKFELSADVSGKNFEFKPAANTPAKSQFAGRYSLKNSNRLSLSFDNVPKGAVTPNGYVTTLLLMRKEKDKSVTQLRKELVETLKFQFEGYQTRMKVGRDPLITILSASNALMRAELDLADNPKERLIAIRENLKRLKGIEALTEQKFELGTATIQDVAQTKAPRLEIEILLKKEEEKSK